MNEAISFFREFVAAEYAALVARFSERDMMTFIKSLRATNRFLHPASRSSPRACGSIRPSRGMPPPEEYWEKAAEALATYCERPLFAALRTEHPKLGELFSFFTGFDLVQSFQGPGVRYDVCRMEGALKIVSCSTQCVTCRTTGIYQDWHVAAGGQCADCSGVGWSQVFSSHPDRVNIGALGPVLEARLLETDLDDGAMAILNGLGASVWF